MGAIGSVTLTDSYKAAYVANASDATLATTATDFATLYGSATKTVKVLKVYVLLSDSGSTHSSNRISLIKRSTLFTGGTSTVITAVPLDSTSSSASATARIFTANPTVGTSVGVIEDIVRITYITVANAYGQPLNDPRLLIFDADKFGQAITLRGTTEGIALNLNGATQFGTTPKARVTFVWTEE